MRMSSDMFPFASHNQYGYSLEYADAELQVSCYFINNRAAT